MRNLKRALSLLLSSAMVIGMMVMGSSAASYTDVTSEENVEAIEVLKAVGVMTGDENGNFNPDKQVTRAEMAVVMANLLDLKVEDFKGASLPFTDVPEWAVPYVAACYADGITAGISATEYGSNNSVTTAQAALMMMKALGYFQYSRDFGSDWQVATVKQGSKIDLFDGIEAGASAAMTRNDVAQLTLNTLEATMVETDGSSTSITLPGGITIDSGDTKYVDVEKIGTKYGAIDGDASDSTNKQTVQLGEQLYNGKLEKAPSGAATETKLGLPGISWVYDGKTVGTYADEADLVVTGYATEKDMYNKVGKTVAEYEGFAFDKDDDDTVVVNYGEVGYFYYDEAKAEGASADDCIFVVSTYVGVVDKVVEADEDEDTPAYVLIEDVEGETVYFETTALDEDDVVIFNKYAYTDEDLAETPDAIALNVAVADSFNGKMTASTDDYIRVDGTKYNMSAEYVSTFIDSTISSLNYNDTYTFYTDAQGNIIAVDLKAEAEKDYKYVVLVEADSEVGDGSLLNGADAKAKVKVMYMDGTEEVLDYAQYKASKDNYEVSDGTLDKGDAYFKVGDTKYTLDSTGDLEAVLTTPGTYYGYTMVDGAIELTPITEIDDAAVETTATIADDVKNVGDYYVNSKTALTVINGDNVATTYTGVANFPDLSIKAVGGDATQALVVFNKDTKMASAIYVVAENFATSNDYTFAYYVGKGETDSEGTKYNFYVDGKAVSYYTDEAAITGATQGDIFDITVSDNEITEAAKVTDFYDDIGETVYIKSIVDNSYVIVTDNGDPTEQTAALDLADNYVSYQISKDGKSVSAVELFSSTKKSAQIILGTEGDDAGKIVAVFYNY